MGLWEVPLGAVPGEGTGDSNQPKHSMLALTRSISCKKL